MRPQTILKLAEKARRIRINALKAIHAAKSGHPGGSLSSADILATLYFGELNIIKESEDGRQNKFVLSKGHAVPALYAALRGESGSEMTLGQVGSKFQRTPNMNKVPGIEISTEQKRTGIFCCGGMAIDELINLVIRR